MMVSAQEPNVDVFSFGQELENAHLETQALQEFKRYIFLQERMQKPINPQVFQIISRLYFNQGEYQKAYRYLQDYRFSTAEYTEKDFLFELELLEKLGFTNSERIRLYILGVKPPPFSLVEKQSILKNMLVSAQFMEWENLRYFLNLSQRTKIFIPDDFNTLDKNISEGEKFAPRSSEFALFLSCIIPGSGQLYAGFPGQAANAFLLNGSLIGLSAFSISRLDFGDLVLLEAPNLYRFYKGNITNTKNLIKQRNETDQKKIAEKIITLLSRYEQ